MDNAWLWLYLFTRLDALHNGAEALIIIGGSVVSFAAIFSFAGTDESHTPMPPPIRRKCFLFGIPVLFLGGFIATFVPTKSDMALIVGGHFVAQGITSEPVVETVQDLYRLVRAELDARLAEIETPEESD